jgi:hypothetical protein
MTKNSWERLIQILSLFLLGWGIKLMLNTPTMILPPWFLVALFLPIVIGISILGGFILKVIFGKKMTFVTYSSIVISLVSVSFIYSEFRPTYIINVPDNFVGEVKLVLSKHAKNDFTVNQFGIGYITLKSYKNGFTPKVFKNGKNITDEISVFSTGSMAWADIHGRSLGPYNYFGFIVPGFKSDSLNTDLFHLIENHAIDTTLLIKGN